MKLPFHGLKSKMWVRVNLKARSQWENIRDIRKSIVLLPGSQALPGCPCDTRSTSSVGEIIVRRGDRRTRRYLSQCNVTDHQHQCTRTDPGSDWANVFRGRRLTSALSRPFHSAAKYDGPECYNRRYKHLPLAIKGLFCQASFVFIKCFSYLEEETQA